MKVSNIKAGAGALGYDVGAGGIVDQLREVGLVVGPNYIEFPDHLLNSVTWVVCWKWEILDGEKGWGQSSGEVNEMRALKRLKDRLIGMGGTDSLEYEDGKWKEGCGPKSAADEDEWPACEQCHAITHDESDGMNRQNAYARLLWNGRLLCDRCRFPDRYTIVPSVDAPTDKPAAEAASEDVMALHCLSNLAWKEIVGDGVLRTVGKYEFVKVFGYESRKVAVRLDEAARVAVLGYGQKRWLQAAGFKERGVWSRLVQNVKGCPGVNGGGWNGMPEGVAV